MEADSTVFDAENDTWKSPVARFCSIPTSIAIMRSRVPEHSRADRMTSPRKWKCSLPNAPLRRLLSTLTNCSDHNLVENLRSAAEISAKESYSWSAYERATLLVLMDLAVLGWRFRVVRDVVYMIPARTHEMSSADSKESVRRTLLAGRAEQLRLPATQSFIASMHRERMHKDRNVSVNLLIDDGQTLANALRIQRNGDLRQIIDPYLQHVRSDTACSETGFSLTDIWRYFRHTWSLEYRPTPGRTLNFLVRNAARPGHPVMAILGLANAVFQLSSRDQTIGWTPEATVLRVMQDTKYWKKWRRNALRCLKAARDAIRSDDLMRSVGRTKSMKTLISKLEDLAGIAQNDRTRALRKIYLEKPNGPGSSKALPRDADGNVDWLAASERTLFIRKRAQTLAEILSAIACLEELNDDSTTLLSAVQLTYVHPQSTEVAAGSDEETFLRHVQSRDLWRPMLRWSDSIIERAFKTAIREIKKNGVASRILDVNVCGATPVYREILGGKLGAQLLFSEEIQRVYLREYRNSESEIASSMAGRAIRRRTRLSALTTTSLYGVGSSQYNRVRYGALRWSHIGTTEGFGTVHFSKSTIGALRSLSVSHQKMRTVNNQFGEGTSPLLRQIREGLDLLGFEANDVLQHSQQRLVYALELYPGAYDDLSLDSDHHVKGPSTVDLAQAWIDRWLRMRIQNDDILKRLEEVKPETVRLGLEGLSLAANENDPGVP